MLAEVVSGNLGILDTVSPLRRLLPQTALFVRAVEGVDLDARTVTLGPGLRPRPLVLRYQRLVLALGGVTDLDRSAAFASTPSLFGTSPTP